MNGDIIEIFKIVLCEDEPFILGYKYKVQCLCIDNVTIDSIFEAINKFQDLQLFIFQEIKKIVYVNVENKSYFCQMPNTYEIQ